MISKEIIIKTHKKGLYEITSQSHNFVSKEKISRGLLNIFIQHTSASLLISENADSTVLQDLEKFMEQLVPEHTDWFTHTLEGVDDMPSHIRSALTNTCLNIPIIKGQLALGTWQGIFLFEHRIHAKNRKILLSIIS